MDWTWLVFVLAMAARPVISRGAIIKALRGSLGNVAAAAEKLKIRRKNLYERIKREGLRLSDYRPKRRMDPGHKSDPDDPSRGHVPKNASDPFPPEANFDTVEPVRTELDPEADIARSRSPRLSEQFKEQLRRGRLELWKTFGVEYDETALLERFRVACFEGWIQSLLADPNDPENQRRGKR